MPSPLHIACTADDRYAPYCAVMLHSLFAHNAQSDVTVHYLHSPEFASALKDKFRWLAERHNAQIHFYEIADDAVKGLPAMRGVQRLVWYRIFLPQLLPELDRVLYLDADTLVTGALDALWQTDLNGHHLGAVLNVIEPRLRYHLGELGLPEHADYFNTGVLLINLAAWRRDHCTTRILEVSRLQGSRFWWGDQDALNVVFPSSCKLLHPRWNCQNNLFLNPLAKTIFGEAVVEEAIRQPRILHFEGPDVLKPWHYLCPHPYREQYWRNLRATGFPIPRAHGLTLKYLAWKYTWWAWGALSAVARWRRPNPGAHDMRS